MTRLKKTQGLMPSDRRVCARSRAAAFLDGLKLQSEFCQHLLLPLGDEVRWNNQKDAFAAPSGEHLQENDARLYGFSQPNIVRD